MMFSSWIESEIKKIESLNIVGCARNVKNGIKLILKLTPKIIVLDLFLDNGSSLKILRAIKEIGLPIKIIVFSNFDFFKKECMALGSDYFFDKSNEFEDFISTIKQMSEESTEL